MSDGAHLVLVTGANGFIGSHLVEALLERGYRVRCMVRRNSDLAFIRDLPVEWAYADLRDADSLRQACRGVDSACHCAALTGALDEETFMRVNTRATEALARICMEVNPSLQRFLYVSSQAAAGPSSGPNQYLDEVCLPQPITWYGKSKLAAERVLCDMRDRLPLTIVRPSPTFGPRDRDFCIYFNLVNRGLGLRMGREERLVSLIYVRDLARLIVLALGDDKALGQTYFGCNQAHSYEDLTATIAKVLDKRPVSISLPQAVLTPIALWSRVQGQLTGRPARLNEQWLLGMRQRYWLCSGEKARHELGFEAQYDLETAVRETADWYRENGWL